MSYYKGAVGEEVRLDTGIDLSGAVSMKINVVYPSSMTTSWIATQYLATEYITYTTVDGDFNETGVYVVYTEVDGVYGDTTTITVVDVGGISEDLVVSAVNAFTWLTCQSKDEDTGGTNTDADILYDSSSANQGNFQLYYQIASERLTSDITKNSISPTVTQRLRALAYLIQDQWERKFKDWDAKEIGVNNDIVKRQILTTSGMASYNSLIKEIVAASSSSSYGGNSTITLYEHQDSVDYPDEWKLMPDTIESVEVV